MRSGPLRGPDPWGSRDKAPSGGGGLRGKAQRIYFFELCPLNRCKNRFITKLISVRYSGFALAGARDSLFGIAVAVCLDLALVFRTF